MSKFNVESRVKRVPLTSSWLILIFLCAVLLSACERPLQEPPDTETLTPGLGLTVVPETAPEESPVLGTPAATTEAGEQPAAEATVETGDPLLTPTDTPVPAAEQRTEEVIYVVVAGDTLGKIADRYGVSIEALIAANNIANPNVLEVGQELVIPVAGDSSALQA